MSKIDNMKLKEAIEIYKKMKRAPSNAYDWYRRSAKSYGKVSIGRKEIDAVKISNQWNIDDGAFKEAIKSHKKRIELEKKYAEDYSKGIYHGKVGQEIIFEGGGYKNYNGFIYVWSNFQRLRKKSDGKWRCRQCGSIANTEYYKPYSINSNYPFCGVECTLSKVYCQNCNTEFDF